MREKKLQIFVSSTFTDLREERQSAVEAILSSGHIPAGMELFAASDESQMTVIRRWIDESDVYLLILGGRYGSIDKLTGKSYTHLEYEYALKKRKALFAVVMNSTALESKVKKKGTTIIEKDSPKEFKEFKELVQKNLVRYWDDKKDIKLAIHETISEFTYREELIGWVKGDSQVNTGFLAEEIAKLTKENSELREKITLISIKEDGTYATLSYAKLSTLLKQKIFSLGDVTFNLFDFILENGTSLAKGRYQDEDLEEIFSELITFKLIQNETTLSDDVFKFTEDGHNFYLRALSQAV